MQVLQAKPPLPPAAHPQAYEVRHLQTVAGRWTVTAPLQSSEPSEPGLAAWPRPAALQGLLCARH